MKIPAVPEMESQKGLKGKCWDPGTYEVKFFVGQ